MLLLVFPKQLSLRTVSSKLSGVKSCLPYMHINNRWLAKKVHLLWCQPGAKCKEKMFSSVWALIGAFGSKAITASSSIRSTLLPIKKRRKGRHSSQWILLGHPRLSSHCAELSTTEGSCNKYAGTVQFVHKSTNAPLHAQPLCLRTSIFSSIPKHAGPVMR